MNESKPVSARDVPLTLISWAAGLVALLCWGRWVLIQIGELGDPPNSLNDSFEHTLLCAWILLLLTAIGLATARRRYNSIGQSFLFNGFTIVSGILALVALCLNEPH